MKKFTLPNGLRILIERKRSRTVAISVVVGTGTIDETEKNNGVAHFVEHMLFRGNERYSSRELLNMVQSQCGMISAITQRTYTQYRMNVLNEGLKTGLIVLREMLFNAAFNLNDIEKEKSVILEEINQNIQDDPTNFSQLEFEKVVNKKTPLGMSIVGKPSTVKSLWREELYSFYKKYYKPNNMAICIVGDVRYAQVVRCVTGLFSGERRGTIKRIATKPNKVKRTKKTVFKSGLKQARLVFGGRAPGINDRQKYAMELLTTLLGKGMNSRLFVRFVDELGIAYSAKCEYNEKERYYFCYMSFSPRELRRATQALMEEIESLIKNKITEEELENAKKYVIGLDALFEDSNQMAAEKYSIAESFGILKETESFEERIRRVSLKDVKDVINRFFSKKNSITITLVPR